MVRPTHARTMCAATAARERAHSALRSLPTWSVLGRWREGICIFADCVVEIIRLPALGRPRRLGPVSALKLCLWQARLKGSVLYLERWNAVGSTLYVRAAAVASMLDQWILSAGLDVRRRR